MGNFKVYKAKCSQNNELNLADAKIKFDTLGTYIHPNLGIPANICINSAFPCIYSQKNNNDKYYDKDVKINMMHLVFPSFFRFDNKKYQNISFFPLSSQKKTAYIKNNVSDDTPISYNLTIDELKNKKNPFRKITIFDKEIYDLPVSSSATLKDLFQVLYWLGYDKFIGGKEISNLSYKNYKSNNYYKINDSKFWNNKRIEKFNTEYNLGWNRIYLGFDRRYFYDKKEPILLSNFMSKTMQTFQKQGNKWVHVDSAFVSSNDIHKGLYTFDMLYEDAKMTDEYFSIYDNAPSKSYMNKYKSVTEQPGRLVFELIGMTSACSNGANMFNPKLNMQFSETYSSILSYLNLYLTCAEIKFIDLVKRNIIEPRKTFSGFDYEFMQ